MGSSYRTEIAITILEFAIWLSILSCFVVVGFDIVEHIQRQRFTEFALEEQIRETSVKPFHHSGAEIDLNLDGISDYIETTADALTEKILNSFGNDTAYFVEVGYAIIEIDEQKGSVSVIGNINSVERHSNNQSDLAEAENKTDLKTHLNNYISEATVQNKFLYATPILGSMPNVSLYEAAGSVQNDRNYMPQSVAVMGRVIFSNTNGTPAEYVKRMIGLEPVYYFVKVSTLRGDFDL